MNSFGHKMNMNSRERLRRCYHHEEPDRPGVFVRSGYPLNDPSYERLRTYINAKTELKADWPAENLISAYPIEHYTEPHSEDFERYVLILHTPGGDLRTSYLQGLKGQLGYQVEHFLKTTEDAKKYLPLPMPEIRGDVSGFFEADKEVANRGIAQAVIGFNPGGSCRRTLRHRGLRHGLHI